jgi:hypothetical protein
MLWCPRSSTLDLAGVKQKCVNKVSTGHPPDLSPTLSAGAGRVAVVAAYSRQESTFGIGALGRAVSKPARKRRCGLYGWLGCRGSLALLWLLAPTPVHHADATVDTAARDPTPLPRLRHRIRTPPTTTAPVPAPATRTSPPTGTQRAAGVCDGEGPRPRTERRRGPWPSRSRPNRRSSSVWPTIRLPRFAWDQASHRFATGHRARHGSQLAERAERAGGRPRAVRSADEQPRHATRIQPWEASH